MQTTLGVGTRGEIGAAHSLCSVPARQSGRVGLRLATMRLPDLDGFAVPDCLAAALDAPHFVLFSSREAAAYGPRLTAAPARGFLPKRELPGAALAALVG